MTNSAPGFAKHPKHSVEISPVNEAILVSIDGVIIAKTDHALMLTEAGYAPTYYLPIDAIPADMLRSSNHTTYCPFKGTAGYFHLVHTGETYENAVWTYRKPYDEALAIEEHISIYPNVAKVGPLSSAK